MSREGVAGNLRTSQPACGQQGVEHIKGAEEQPGGPGRGSLSRGWLPGRCPLPRPHLAWAQKARRPPGRAHTGGLGEEQACCGTDGRRDG